jgi:hypothetical protein
MGNIPSINAIKSSALNPWECDWEFDCRFDREFDWEFDDDADADFVEDIDDNTGVVEDDGGRDDVVAVAALTRAIRSDLITSAAAPL